MLKGNFLVLLFVFIRCAALRSWPLGLASYFYKLVAGKSEVEAYFQSSSKIGLIFIYSFYQKIAQSQAY